MYKISFCTAIKNRLHHLQQTLPLNIKDNEMYNDVTFVILDYNSTDGLEYWIKSNLTKYIESGKVVFYRTSTPSFFHRGHSRNLAFRLADGEILCNVDADNYIGPGFADFISKTFASNEKIYLAPGTGESTKADFFGRICCKKMNFFDVSGYDEQMEGYGFEDHDLINKLDELGLTKKGIPAKFLNGIAHQDFERVSEERLFKTLHCLYLSHVNSSESDVIYMLNDGTYFHGAIIDCIARDSVSLDLAINRQQNSHAFIVKNDAWIIGRWSTGNGHLIFENFNDSMPETHFKNKREKQITHGKKVYNKIFDQEIIVNLIMFDSQFRNRTKMKHNLVSKRDPTLYNFGKGQVYKNFDYNTSIEI